MEEIVNAYFHLHGRCDSLQIGDEETKEFCDAMISNHGVSEDNEILYIGVSGTSFTQQLRRILCYWNEYGVNPLSQRKFTSSNGMSEDSTSLNHILTIPLVNVRDIRDIESFDAFVRQLGGARGILTLLGFRCTIGSQIRCPPTRAECMAAFNLKHSTVKTSILTIGARQWTKHVERSLNKWWGVNKGSEMQKNQYAEAKIIEILNTATWINVHGLPNGPVVYEIRQHDGYGARWGFQSHDVHFRGFVEPYMENGHELNWRHS